MKSHIRYFLKNRLPIFIIILSIFLIIGVVSASRLSFVEQVLQETGHYYDGYEPTESGILPLAFAVCIVMALLPLFNMSARFSLAKTELLRQTAHNKKAYRYVENGLSIGIVLASYTISFLIFLLIAIIKNCAQPLPENTHMYHYYRVYFNYSPYFFVYLLTVVFAIGNYFITYLFASRSNNLLNSIILVVLGQLFMGFFPALFAEFEGPALRFFMQTPLCNSSVSFGPLFLDYRYSNWIVQGDSSYLYKFIANYDNITLSQAIRFTTYSFVSFFSVAILGIASFFFEKDPSGEWAGKPETKEPYQEICYNLFIGSMFTIFIYWIIKEWNDSSMMQLVFWFVFYLVVYYVLYGVIKRNFKPKLYQIIVMVSNTALLVIVGFIIFGCIGFTPVEY